MLGAIALYALLGFFLAPYLLEKNLVQTMKQDFDAELRIDKIEVNPFVLSLRINGLELDDPQGEPSLRIQEIFGNFQLSSIFRLALTFDEIRFSSPELYLARDKSGNLNIAYLTPPAETGSETETAADEGDSSPLPALIHNFTIENSLINWSDQLPPEPVNTRFGPVDISIKDLNTLPDRHGQQNVVIATESSGTLSWSGNLQLNPLRSAGKAALRDSRFPVLSAYIRHQTGVDVVDGAADVALDYEVFTDANGEIQARIENFNLTLTDVIVNSFADGTGIDLAGPDQQILKLPQVRVTDGRLQWPEQIVSLGSISIESPQIDTLRDENGVFNLEPRQAEADAGAASEPAASGDDAAASGIEWQVSVANFAINGLVLNLLDRSVTPAAELGITDFNLSISDISNLQGKRFPTTLSLKPTAGGKLSLEGEFEVLPQPSFEFDVTLDAVQLSGAQPYLRQQANLNMDSGALNLDGRIRSSGDERFAYQGNLEVVDLNIAESIDNKRLASWQSLRLEKIALSTSKRQLDISRVRFDRLYGDILINEDGSLNVGQVAKPKAGDGEDAAASEPPEESVESAADDSETAFNVRIGDVVLADASADFRDLSLPLPFAVKIDALNGKMTTIATRSNEPSEVAFEGKVDEYGLARVSGVVTPLDPAQNTDLLVEFENIDVPNLTPYSIPFAGREIDSGKLDLKLGYAVKDSQLVGENSIILRDFELGKEVPHPDALDLPLGLAVALLKDVNGKIDIQLPVRGNLNEPEFSYGSVVMSALGKLLVKIVLSPFTALGSMLGMEANELEYVNFPDGRADLTPPEMEKSAKLAEALSQRPELQLVIAGVTDASADGLALRIARVDAILEQRIDELGASSSAQTQYADLRRMALEQLYDEQLATGAVTQTLEELRTQFTMLVEVEGQADPEPSLDALAYANELRQRLIDLQTIDSGELDMLASARAEALKSALLAVDADLQPRISIIENAAVTRDADEPIKMKIELTGKSE